MFTGFDMFDCRIDMASSTTALTELLGSKKL